MTLKFLITVITLITALIFVTVTIIFIRRNKSKPETWPRFIGVGSGVYLFIPLMVQSILSRPLSELLGYTVSNTILSLGLGIMAYFSIRKIKIVRDKQNRN